MFSLSGKISDKLRSKFTSDSPEMNPKRKEVVEKPKPRQKGQQVLLQGKGRKGGPASKRTGN